MKNNWRECQLGDVIELKRGYDLPQRERRVGNVPIVSSSGVSGTHESAMVKGPGVVTGRYGTLGEVFLIRQDFWPLNTTLYVRDFKGNDPQFISYFLRTLDFLAYSDKAAVPGLNRNHLHQAKVVCPPVEAQRRIADILGSLDDKIELNRRTNETLDTMARTLVRSWFVDFDPVKAKSDGQKPQGTDAATVKLFPDSFEMSRIGRVPRGWPVISIGDHIETVKGLSYKGEGLADAGMPLHNLNSVYEGGGYKYEGIKFYTGEYKDRHLVRPGDVIVTNTEQGHDLLLIGYPAIVPKFYGESGLFSHHLYRVRPRDSSPLTNHFIYFQLMDRRFRDEVTGHTNGTTVNMLAADGLQRPLFALPPSELIQAFDRFVAPLFQKAEQLHGESLDLERTRDALLPKLLSGEVRVDPSEGVRHA